MPPSPLPRDQRSESSGVWFGLAAYLSWGFFPLYFKAVGQASPMEILAHRILWSTLLLLGLATATGAIRRLANPATAGLRLRTLATTTLLISCNWLLYIWAVAHQRVVEASLGYFITPLVNVLLGVLLLGERLNGLQRISVALALLGVLSLVALHGHVPLIAIALAVSFGLYGFFRKRGGVDPVLGLLGETALVTPLAAAYLAWLGARGAGQWGTGGWRLTLLLTAAGLITSAPLVWFSEAARRLPLSTLGLLQYLSPTVQLLLAIFLFGERFHPAQGVAFGLIWLSLALYSFDAWKRIVPQTMNFETVAARKDGGTRLP